MAGVCANIVNYFNADSILVKLI